MLTAKRRRVAAMAPLLFGAFSFCNQATASFEDGITSWIYGGEPAKTCEWPTTVGLGGCTGTLIHPRVVLYAAHCGSRISSAQFGEQYRSKISHKVKTVRCKVNPEFKGQSSLGRGVDSAYCVLEKPVEDVAIAPVFYGCEVEELKEGGTIWLVGFGKNNNSEGLAKAGIKFKVETDFVKYKSNEGELEVGSNGKTACNGDSGGPAFMKMSDGSWRTIGITSYGVDTSCTKVAYYSNAAKAIPWIQKDLNSEGYEDIDLTPCFDDDGKWNPSDKCGGFAKDPGTAYGSWDNFCSEGAPKSGASSLCGDPNPKAGAVDDKTAPEVEITTPEHKDRASSDETLEVEVKASDDIDEQPDVVLLVDGEEQMKLEEGPYTWELEDLSAGDHTLQAIATDEAGNEAKSKKIKIEIEEKEDEPDEDSDSDGKDSEDEDSDSQDADGGSDKGNDDEEDDDDANSDETSELKDKGSGCSTQDPPALGWGMASLLLFGLGRRRFRR